MKGNMLIGWHITIMTLIISISLIVINNGTNLSLSFNTHYDLRNCSIMKCYSITWVKCEIVRKQKRKLIMWFIWNIIMSLNEVIIIKGPIG